VLQFPTLGNAVSCRDFGRQLHDLEEVHGN